jgi:hypothetical protein
MTGRQTTFTEVMAGPVRIGAEQNDLRLDLAVAVPGLLLLWGDAEARLSGHVTLPGVADPAPATGTRGI